ncbi:MAG: PRC-barrel domain-containing protein [Hyphomicrobiaceae bacterium]
MSRLLPAVAIAVLLGGSAAVAQTTKPGDTTPSPSTPGTTAPPSATTPGHMPSTATGATESTAQTMTEAEAKKWVDKTVYSSDNKNVGEVAVIKRDASGKVTELDADIGGFLGIGSKRVMLMPSQFKLSGDRVELSLTAEQVKALPQVKK